MFVKATFEYIVVKRFKFTKFLLVAMKKKAGRSSMGNIVVSGLGGGYKRFYRLIDFLRIIYSIPARIVKYEYDPNRNTFILLLNYINGVFSYILAPSLLKSKFFLLNGLMAYPVSGNHLPLFKCPTGSFIHCVKINSIKSKLGRSAGVCIQLVRKIGTYALLRLASGEERFISVFEFCTLGRLSFETCKLIAYTSAGKNRRLGRKSKVRGVAKNPIDHPHGGGEGRTTAAQPSVSPWGIYTKGVRTTTRLTRLNLLKWGFFKRRDGKVW
jgi:large subunit ribosomal protein L2